MHIAKHLLAHHLLTARDVVDGDVKIVDAPRRNQNFRVTASGAGYFIKQGLGEDRSRTIGREAAFLRFAASSAPEELVAHLPHVRMWDVGSGTLVCDLIPDSRSLAEHQGHGQRYSATIAGQVGSALAGLHTWQPAVNEQGNLPFIDSGPPRILSLHRPDLSIFVRRSGAGLEVVKIVQSSQPIWEALDEFRSSWQASAIIHGDLKPDNVVVYRRSPGKRAYNVVLVDWELVQLGDPLWDVASFLSLYLDVWIESIPVVSIDSPATPPAQVPLEKLQPAMTRFWDAYAQGVGLTECERAGAVERLAQYAAIRLIQTAIEADQRAARLSNTGILRLQVAENMLLRPAEAAASLFDISNLAEAVRG